jgi:hypothetical protein
MTRILACTTCPEDWQQFLARPDRHWRTGYSAKALAHAWEAADGLPPEIKAAMDAEPSGELRDPQAYYAVPEFKTDLPGGLAASQTDVLVLGRAQGGGFAMAVEGKVSESFGPTLTEWQVGMSEGKKERWAYLCSTLQILETQPGDLRYQLFHRTASAILAAKQFHCPIALVVVHSFSDRRAGFVDFAAFMKPFGLTAEPGRIGQLTAFQSPKLYAGWVTGEARFAQA